MKETSFMLFNESKGKKCTLYQVHSLHRTYKSYKSLTALVLVNFLADEKGLLLVNRKRKTMWIP